MNLAAERQLHTALMGFVAACGLVVMWALRRRVAPYGRHASEHRGPTVSPKVAWVVMESPAVVVFAAVYALGEHAGDLAPLALITVWQLHYMHRTFVFPLRMRGGTPMPRYIVATAFGFNCINAYLNARWLSALGEYSTAWLGDPRFVIGVGLFTVGMAINLSADATLRALRGPGERGYAIPRGGLFEWVSCPNYLGELIEWIGFAVASWSPAAWVFAWFTAANLLPRAAAHHAWYRATFSEYPARRRAAIPWVW